MANPLLLQAWRTAPYVLLSGGGLPLLSSHLAGPVAGLEQPSGGPSRMLWPLGGLAGLAELPVSPPPTAMRLVAADEPGPYVVGDVVRYLLTVQDGAVVVAADRGTVRFALRGPDGVQRVDLAHEAYPGGVAQVGLGLYRAQVAADLPGVWVGRWQAVLRGELRVRYHAVFVAPRPFDPEPR